jgi:hypothetical protein
MTAAAGDSGLELSEASLAKAETQGIAAGPAPKNEMRIGASVIAKERYREEAGRAFGESPRWAAGET